MFNEYVIRSCRMIFGCPARLHVTNVKSCTYTSRDDFHRLMWDLPNWWYHGNRRKNGDQTVMT